MAWESMVLIPGPSSSAQSTVLRTDNGRTVGSYDDVVWFSAKHMQVDVNRCQLGLVCLDLKR
jgi:hypothetical protein